MKDKVIVVTGASSGIGRACALKFAKNGAKLVLSDIDEKGGRETLDLIVPYQVETIFVPCNVSSKSELASLFDQAVSTYGRIDAVINNAGIGGVLAPSHSYPDDVYHEVIAVNQTSVFYSMKLSIPIMLSQGQGCIVNVSSVAGIGAAAGMSAYAASKHAVIGLTRTAAREYGEHGIRINAICPTVINTPMTKDFMESDASFVDAIKNSIALKRFGEPEEVADVIYWLCSDESKFITGQEIKVDGGMKT